MVQAISESIVSADYEGSNSWEESDPSVFKMTVLTDTILKGEYQITNGYGPHRASKIMRVILLSTSTCEKKLKKKDQQGPAI